MGLASGLRHVAGRRDVWVGLLFLTLGLLVLAEVSGFEGSAARLPRLAGVMLAGLGAALFVRALLLDGASRPDWVRLKAMAAGPVANALLLVLWVYLVGRGFGYFELGVPLVMASVYLMGHRRLLTNAVYSLAIVGVVFVLFYAVFRVRLPVSSFVAYVFG